MGPIPVPESGTICGLGLELSAIVIAPLIAAVAFGVNVTLMVQLAWGGSVAGQDVVLYCPLATNDVMVNVLVVLVFFRTTF
jgi:hypothetical protein